MFDFKSDNKLRTTEQGNGGLYSLNKAKYPQAPNLQLFFPFAVFLMCS